jgi:hypothetical protein
MECEELDESKENVGFHVLYRLILSLNLFARYTFCIAIFVLYRASMSITSSWRLNTIQSRAPGCVWNSGQNPVYTAADPSDAVLTLLIHGPVCRT